jgi:hypothetical protein
MIRMNNVMEAGGNGMRKIKTKVGREKKGMTVKFIP